MNQPKSPQKRAFEIQVSFETSRLSSEYLMRAYEQLVPSVQLTAPLIKQANGRAYWMQIIFANQCSWAFRRSAVVGLRNTH
jgi:hypothetical protein